MAFSVTEAPQEAPTAENRMVSALTLNSVARAVETLSNLVDQGVVEALSLDPDRVIAEQGDDCTGAGVQGADGALAAVLEVVDVGDRGHPELSAPAELQADVHALPEQADRGQDEQHRRDCVPKLLTTHDVEGAFAGEEVVAELGEALHDWFPSVAARLVAMVTRPRPA